MEKNKGKYDKGVTQAMPIFDERYMAKVERVTI